MASGYTLDAIKGRSLPAIAGIKRSHSPRNWLDENKPINRGMIETDTYTPIAVAFDGTGSMGDKTNYFYKRAPMFYGQIVTNGWMDDPAISLCMVEDSDEDEGRGPDEWGIQVTDFARGDTLDDALEGMVYSKGGGGNGGESYQLAMYYYARKASFPVGDTKPLLFFYGDEPILPYVSPHQAMKFFGDIIKEPISFEQLAVELNKNWDVYLFGPYGYEEAKDAPAAARPYRLHKPGSARAGRRRLSGWVEGMYTGSVGLTPYQWWQVCGKKPENLIELNDWNGVVDYMLGIVAMNNGGLTLSEYKDSMRRRHQSARRISAVAEGLRDWARIRRKL